MLKACKTGCIAITGNEKPEMENDITPHKEAKLSPSRKVGKVPIMTTPQHCEARTRQSVDKAIVNKDHNFGNARWVRNIFEKTLEIQANCLAMDGHISNKSLTTITEYNIMNKTN